MIASRPPAPARARPTAQLPNSALQHRLPQLDASAAVLQGAYVAVDAALARHLIAHEVRVVGGRHEVVREWARHVLVDVVHLAEVANVVEVGEEKEPAEALPAQQGLLPAPGRGLKLVDNQFAIFIRHVLHVLRLARKEERNVRICTTDGRCVPCLFSLKEALQFARRQRKPRMLDAVLEKDLVELVPLQEVVVELEAAEMG